MFNTPRLSNACHVKIPALVELREAYRRPLEAALAKAAWVLLLLVIVLGAHLARAGSLTTRVSVGLSLAFALAVLLLHRGVFRRRLRDEAGVVKTALTAADPASGTRVLRALSLAEAVEATPRGQSPELARLHLSRSLSRFDARHVGELAEQRARGFRQFARLGMAAAALVVVLSPWQVLEGLNVLTARAGRAPVEMNWLEYVHVTAAPPSYLQKKSGFLMLETAAALPEGTELSFRGVPLHAGRELVLTDGQAEVPFVDDGSGSVVARWTLERSSTLRIAARFGDTLIYEPRSIELHSQPDEVPRVELEGAPKDFRLEELGKLELLWQAVDDHSLLQVDLVLRSAGKEERRTLESFPGDKRTGRGGHVLYADDAFFKRVFLPVVIRIEARDNDPREGNKWGRSEAFVVRPPGVGSPELNRFQALSSLREQLVNLLAAQLDAEGATAPDAKAAQRKDLLERVATLRQTSQTVFSSNYSGLTVPRGWSAFMDGQLERLERAFSRRQKERETIESIVLGVNSALSSLASKDSKDVARQLGDVAEEAAFGARLGQEPEKGQEGVERLDIAIEVLDNGANELLRLDVLGADLGSVALADLARVRRSRERKDFFHAELAALHMAERLRRPNPSFGSKGGGGGGVEAGSGGSGGKQSEAQGEPSDVDSEFERMARDLESLAQDHADLVDRTSDAMRSAASDTEPAGDKGEAERRAEELRRSVVGLPQPGEAPGTGRASAALMREHAGAMAHELERLNFEGALDSGRRARAAAEEALRSSDLPQHTREQVEQALAELEEQLEWARARAERQRQAVQEAARQALSEYAGLERELAERASRLAQEAGGKAALPQDVRERLDEASSLMQRAARHLRDGEGERALERQTEAQRLLEQSETGDMQESGSDGQQHAGDDGGRKMRTGGDVPDPSEQNGAEDFRRRVLEGLAEQAGGRLSPAVKRYAEGLLR